MANNPITSQDLYQPGPQDTLAMLKRELEAIQNSVRELEALARSLKKTLSSGGLSPAKVVAAATEAEAIASKKRVLLAREAATAQRLENKTLADKAILEQRVAAATSRANIVRQREIDLANKQTKATKSHHSSLTGLVGSIRNLAYAYFSLGAAAQVFQSILKQTKALDTLTVAFNTTLGSAQATAQAQEYLLDISERFGTNLLGASQAYLKFSAASKQAGVSAEETQKIFTSVTKASSILGLGAERTSYVFLALEQIMSKGRLSTEELRRQLGEHLPGAFGIAAQAMGVTTAKLTDMLKKGEIASTDFLPKFAKQLEKAYGLEQVERIDNLAAAQERFNNQLTLLIKELSLSDAFKDFFNTLSDGVKFVVQNIEGISKLAKAVLQLVIAYTAYKAIMIANKALTTFFLVSSLQQLTLTKALEAAQLRLSLAIRAVNIAWKANPLGFIIAGVSALVVGLDYLIDRYDGVKNAQKAIDEAMASGAASTAAQEFQFNQLADAYAENQSKLSRLEEGTKEYNEIAEQQKTILGQLSAAGVDVVDSNNDQIISQDEVTASIEKYLVSAQKKAKIDALLSKISSLASEQALLDLELASPEGINRGTAAGQLFDRIFGTQLTDVGKAQRRDEIIKEIGGIETYIKGLGDPFDILGGKPDAAAAPPEGDGGNKDTFDALKERLALILNNQERELAELQLAYERKKADFIAHNEDITGLEDKYAHDRAEIINKYLDIEVKAFEDAEKDKKEAFKDATDEVKKYLDQRRQAIEDAETRRKFNVDTLRDEFNARRKHEEEIFDLSKHSEEEIADFKLKLKIDELNDEIQLHRIFGKVLSDEELARAIELRDKMQAAMDLPNTAGTKQEIDIFSLLGINFGEGAEGEAKKQVVIDALDFAKSQLTDFLDFQKEIIDQEIENADRKVRAAEENLNRQIALQTANQANNVAGAQAELALAKKTQEEALKQRQKFQKQELALNTALEASNLTVAIAKTLATFPGPVGIALAATMITAFAAAKIKAFQLANKKTFRKGGFKEIGGGSHESGNDTHVGGNNYAENGESVGIFTAKATRKYKPSLKALVNAANKGTLENILVQDRRAIQGINLINKTDIDTSLMEKRLTRLVSLSESKTFVDGKGRLVRMDRGRTTIINR